MTQEKKQVLFMWRSPLHSMSDPDRGHPYDILDVSKTDLETPLEISVDQDFISNPEQAQSNWLLNDQSTFQKFGYSDMPDIDTSDDESNELNHDTSLTINGSTSGVWSASHNKVNHITKTRSKNSLYTENDVSLTIALKATNDNHIGGDSSVLKIESVDGDKNQAEVYNNSEQSNIIQKTSIKDNTYTVKQLPQLKFDIQESFFKSNDHYHCSEEVKMENHEVERTEKLEKYPNAKNDRTEIFLNSQVKCNTADMKQKITNDIGSVTVEEPGKEILNENQPEITLSEGNAINQNGEDEVPDKDFNNVFDERRLSGESIDNELETIISLSFNSKDSDKSPVKGKLNSKNFSTMEYTNNSSTKKIECLLPNLKCKPVMKNTGQVFDNLCSTDLTTSGDESENSDDEKLNFSNFSQNLKSDELKTLESLPKFQQKTKHLGKQLKKTFDTSINFLHDLCRISAFKSENSEVKSAGSSDNSENDLQTKPLGLQIQNCTLELVQKGKSESTMLDRFQSDLSVCKNTKHVNQPARHIDTSMSDLESPFLIKHFLISNRRNEGPSLSFTYSVKSGLSKSMSAIPQTEERIKDRYTKKCHEIERKMTRENYGMHSAQDKQFWKHQTYWEDDDIPLLSFEEKANQPWKLMDSQSLNVASPNSLYENNCSWNASDQEIEYVSRHHGEYSEEQNSVANVYGSDVCRHHSNHNNHHHAGSDCHHNHDHHFHDDHHNQHHHIHHHPSCPADKYSNCNDRILDTCEHLRHRHMEDYTTDKEQKMLTSTSRSGRWSHGNNHSTLTGDQDSGNCGCQSCCIKGHLKLLTEYMELQGYEVKNVSGDGNCLFAAIVDQLRINGDLSFTTESLRKRSVELLKNRPLIDGDTHMSAFLTSESWDEYLARMALDGEWGDDIVLRGISELTGRKIVVYSSFQSRTVLTPTNVFEKEELYIGHIRSMMHFVSLRPHFWNMLWPGLARMKRMQSSIEELKYTEVLYAKFDLVQEYILQKNIHGASTVLREISKALDNSNKQSKILLEKRESRETMMALVEEKCSIDLRSGVSMLHLSFILKLLIDGKYFRTSNDDQGSCMSLYDTNEYTMSIGMNELGLDTSLLDITKAMQHFEPIKKKNITEKKAISYTFLRMPPKDTYLVTDKEDIHALNQSIRALKIVTSGTYPGYLRLMPQNPANWPECVEWLALNEGYLHTLNLKLIPESPVPGVYMTQFEGLQCQSWPTAALSWKERKTQSGWPSKCIIQEAMNKGCSLIKRSHEFSERPNIEWRFVFHDAERVLVKSFDGPMKYGFNVFKALVEYHTRTLAIKIKPYIMLTVMFYCCEEIPIEAWSSNPGGCVMYLVAWLLQHLHGHDLPNYFIEENNMLEHIDEKDVKNLEYYLDAIRWFPLASVYFLLENHSFLNLHMIDRIESSMDDYRRTNNARKIVESVFVPICFEMASYSMKTNVLPFLKNAMNYLELAFEQASSVYNDRTSLSFEDFVQRYFSTVGNKSKTIFCQLVDKEKKTNLCRNLLNEKLALPISKILGPQYHGPWQNVVVDATPEDKWNSIYELTTHLAIGGDANECIEILRCSISVLHQELVGDDMESADPTEILDEIKRKQLQQERLKQVYVILRCLVTFYKNLATCYDSLDTIELFQEHIHDYEDIVNRVDSSMHYEYLAKLFRKLGNQDKADEIEKKTKEFGTDGQSRRMLMLLIRQ